RRRHTRCYRDWSSDVCSSDLVADLVKGGEVIDLVIADFLKDDVEVFEWQDSFRLLFPYSVGDCADLCVETAAGESGEVREPALRSEERRVGKECRGERSRGEY